MSNNIVIKTTFKNNLYMMRPFYKFHQKVWRPRRFVFIIGYTGTEKQEIDKIEKIFPSYILDKHKYLGSIGALAQNVKLYEKGHLFFILYKTPENYKETFTWDRLKVDILRRIDKFIQGDSFKRHFTVDNDDFHYVENSEQAIKKDVLYFHSMEFIPSKEKPTMSSDFDFVGMRYFFRRKGCGGKVANSCSGCSVVFWEPFNNVCHNSKYDKHRNKHCDPKIKSLKNGLTEKNLNELDGFCFSFACISQESLMKEKHWISSIPKPTMRHSLTKKTDNRTV